MSRVGPKGIRKIKTGWQAYTTIRGRFVSKVFPPATGMLVMRRWREEQRVRSRLGAALPAAGPTLAEDVAAYLQMVQTMPTLRHRRDDLRLWIAVFGPDRLRKTITAGEIRAQLETWRTDGYAANTVNHRRTALMHLWTVLDGKSAPNPARDVPRYPDDSRHAPPRALSLAAVVALLRTMPPSQTRARLRLMATTGWPPAQLARLTPTDIDWGRAVYLRPRRKGQGAPGVWLPLLPHAWRALRSFKRYGCWGPYSTSAARTSLRRAAAAVRASDRYPDSVKAEVADVTPYQLRHSFLTWVAAATGDDRGVMELALHTDIRQTHWYTQATAAPRAAAALENLARTAKPLARSPQLPDSKE